ncbi:hypothetical protein ACJX0J_039790, partial [Zea mays]
LVLVSPFFQSANIRPIDWFGSVVLFVLFYAPITNLLNISLIHLSMEGPISYALWAQNTHLSLFHNIYLFIDNEEELWLFHLQAAGDCDSLLQSRPSIHLTKE